MTFFYCLCHGNPSLQFTTMEKRFFCVKRRVIDTVRRPYSNGWILSSLCRSLGKYSICLIMKFKGYG